MRSRSAVVLVLFLVSTQLMPVALAGDPRYFGDENNSFQDRWFEVPAGNHDSWELHVPSGKYASWKIEVVCDDNSTDSCTRPKIDGYLLREDQFVDYEDADTDSFSFIDAREDVVKWEAQSPEGLGIWYLVIDNQQVTETGAGGSTDVFYHLSLEFAEDTPGFEIWIGLAGLLLAVVIVQVTRRR